MRIERIEAFDLRVPLKRPYHWAGGEIRDLTTIIVTIEAGSRRGAGECTTVPGYSWEGPAQAWGFTRQHAPSLVGRSPEEACRALQRQRHDFPFSVSAYLTALEEVLGADALRPPAEERRLRLLGTVNVDSDNDVRAVVPHLLAAGYTTLKVKVGFDLEHDIARARLVQSLVEDQARIRFDANQAYSLDKARSFAHSVDPANVELFEQPFAPDAWDAMVTLARDCPVPLMLDESIFSEKDIDRTHRLGCAHYIKLKLMKAGSASDLARQIRRVQGHGIGVVLGNGAAADPGCYHEVLVATHCGVATAGEMNGFLKPRASLLKQSIPVDGPDVVVRPDFRLEPDPLRLHEFAVAHAVWE
ncbi:MAG TPA: hypothetical protein DEP84_13205 [Chloroflexi bacterium]|nr:hypothetical protein [Chloroflexota bacterium]